MRSLLLTLLLTGCTPSPQKFTVMFCSKDGSVCQIGGVVFNSLEDCNDFVAQASRIQPHVGRICIKAQN